VARRAFGQYCGLARALEIVGERWALLIVRDLLVGARRFTDLHRGLPRIPTNVLADRLKELETAGVVQRRVLPRPAGSIVYELTPLGRGLEGPLLALSRWGTHALGEMRPGEILTAESLVITLRAIVQPHAAARLQAGFELRMDNVLVSAKVERGNVEVVEGPLPGAQLRIETTPAVLPRLLSGEIDPAAALDQGLIKTCGDPRLLDAFVALFPISRTA
jgi:DNA-binding HxlR family transcriptional regulator